jgi:cysteinyl-tRNA synthetase
VRDGTLDAATKCATLQAMDVVLDIGLRDPIDTALASLGVISKDTLPAAVETLMTAREIARQEKNWAESDRLRAEMNLLGYTVEDTPHGPKITKV